MLPIVPFTSRTTAAASSAKSASAAAAPNAAVCTAEVSGDEKHFLHLACNPFG